LNQPCAHQFIKRTTKLQGINKAHRPTYISRALWKTKLGALNYWPCSLIAILNHTPCW